MREPWDETAVRSHGGFDEFYLNEYSAVVALAYALSGSRWAAEELAQEAFLATYRNWERIGGYDQPRAWVRRVVANLAVSALRRRMSEARALTRFAMNRAPSVADLSADDGEFWRAVRSLPRRQAQVIALHYLEDQPISGIAVVLEMAPGTVKKHLYDGRKALARRLHLEEDDS